MHLFEKLSPQVYDDLIKRTVVRLNGDVDRARDVVQEAFAKAILKRHQLRDETKFEHWLSVIVKNETLYELRRTAEQYKRAILVSDDSDYDYMPLKHDRSTEDIVLTRIELEQFASYVESLPGLTKQIIVLHSEDGLSFREISKLVGMPLESVKARYYRAFQRYSHLERE